MVFLSSTGNTFKQPGHQSTRRPGLTPAPQKFSLPKKPIFPHATLYLPTSLQPTACSLGGLRLLLVTGAPHTSLAPGNRIFHFFQSIQIRRSLRLKRTIPHSTSAFVDHLFGSKGMSSVMCLVGRQKFFLSCKMLRDVLKGFQKGIQLCHEPCSRPGHP